ncbi:hypothetical protein [Pseudomonas aeruginosa]|uniref:hypothetical protein n=1 Tax=Pseudomonas aeruginosa TaxID=287 RepID=UPI0019D229DF|nr:hypothetical protein [Pseudomonas aeruginosa]
MTESKICTCPSGDGSLVHPCPAHPAVEQVGGDERAVDGKPRATKCPDCGEGDLMPGDLCACGYETDPSAGYACSECDGSGDGYVGEVCRECDGSGWFVTPEQARAALAQLSGEVVVTENESGAIVSVTRQDKEGRVLSVIAESATLTAQSDQAEAERPEVVAWSNWKVGTRSHVPFRTEEEAARSVNASEIVATQEGPYSVEPLMTVAQHERIVGALRAELETERMRLAGCGVAALGYFDGCVDAYKSASLSDVLRLRADCDAALARVAELTATRNRYGVDAHYFNKNLQRILRDFESFTPDELARSLIILAKVADEKVVAQAQHSVPELLEWAVGRWHAEVSLRPLINVHRRALDDTWRQVIRRLGGDTGLLCGPSHDELLAAAPGKEGNDD